MRTIAIVNQKGGSGKTTTAVNVACLLARRSQRTLLVDMDPQSHCALGLSAPEKSVEHGTADVLLGNTTLEDAAWRVGKHLDLVPSTTRLAGVEAARGGLAEAEDRGDRLAQALASASGRYDWALIDCPPSIGLLTYNALRAADEVLIPVEAGYFALRASERQAAALASLDKRTGRETIRRFVLTMHDPDRGVSRDVRDRLRSTFGDCVIPIEVRWDLAVKEAAAMGIGVGEHAPASHAAEDYERLTSFLLEHVREREPVADGAGGAPGSNGSGNGHAAVAQLEPKTTTLSRAAELAERTRRLMARSAEAAGRAEAHGAATAAAALATDTAQRGEQQDEAAAARARSAATLFGVRETSRGLLFVFPAGPEAEVAVASDVNGWSARAHRMRYNPAIGAHELCVAFPPGAHRYRYVVDGEWITDPHNERSAPNPYGQLDSVVVVGGES